jgi:phospholipid/cholesterol/gamma-HCH transport system substrate-binding protein
VENRANYILVGSFVLLVVLGLFGFVIWLAKIEVDREFARYTIYFDGSVSGLSTASNVLYNGIPVGTVGSIRIDPQNPQRVRVVVDIATDTPVKKDSDDGRSPPPFLPPPPPPPPPPQARP